MFDQDIFHAKRLCEATAKSVHNEGARAMTMFFSKNSHCDLDLGLRILKLKIIQDIVILHICGKLNQNQFINEGVRVRICSFLIF